MCLCFALFVVVFQSLSRVSLFATPWTTARQASLSFTVSQSLLRFMSIEPSNDVIFCRPFLLLPSIFLSMRVFPVTQLFTSGGQSIGASASVLPMNIQGWFSLGLTELGVGRFLNWKAQVSESTFYWPFSLLCVILPQCLYFYSLSFLHKLHSWALVPGSAWC